MFISYVSMATQGLFSLALYCIESTLGKLLIYLYIFAEGIYCEWASG